MQQMITPEVSTEGVAFEPVVDRDSESWVQKADREGLVRDDAAGRADAEVGPDEVSQFAVGMPVSVDGAVDSLLTGFGAGIGFAGESAEGPDDESEGLFDAFCGVVGFGCQE
jgi:hypothetical protein